MVLILALQAFASDAPKKAAAPDKNAQVEAMKLVKEVDGAEWTAAKTDEVKQALAKKLLEKAKKNEKDKAARSAPQTGRGHRHSGRR